VLKLRSHVYFLPFYFIDLHLGVHPLFLEGVSEKAFFPERRNLLKYKGSHFVKTCGNTLLVFFKELYHFGTRGEILEVILDKIELWLHF
jgi:hypothetical protein